MSSVTLPSPLEMFSNPVNLPCGTKCWREFNIFWSGYFVFVLFIIIVIIIINIIIIIIIIIAETDLCSCKRAGSHYRLIFILAGSKKKVTQPEIKIKLTTLGSHFNQVKIKNVNHAGNLTAGKLTFPRTNHAAEQDTLHRDYSPVVFSYSTTTKSTACFCFADGKMDK